MTQSCFYNGIRLDTDINEGILGIIVESKAWISNCQQQTAISGWIFILRVHLVERWASDWVVNGSQHCEPICNWHEII